MASQITAYGMVMMKLKSQGYDLMASSLDFVPDSGFPWLCAPEAVAEVVPVVYGLSKSSCVWRASDWCTFTWGKVTRTDLASGVVQRASAACRVRCHLIGLGNHLSDYSGLFWRGDSPGELGGGDVEAVS